MSKLNKNIKIGIFLNALNMLLREFIHLPDIIAGLLLGMSIAFLLTGVYSLNHDISRLRAFKIKLTRHLLFKN